MFGNKEVTVSFLGIHKSDPAIYIGISPALHLQRTDSIEALPKLTCKVVSVRQICIIQRPQASVHGLLSVSLFHAPVHVN
jgi:hypothetical protein